MTAAREENHFACDVDTATGTENYFGSDFNTGFKK